MWIGSIFPEVKQGLTVESTVCDLQSNVIKKPDRRNMQVFALSFSQSVIIFKLNIQVTVKHCE